MHDPMPTTRQAPIYETPRVERFGTFRQLTQLGPSMGNDFTSIFGPNAPVGCTPEGGPGFGCGRS